MASAAFARGAAAPSSKGSNFGLPMSTRESAASQSQSKTSTTPRPKPLVRSCGFTAPARWAGKPTWTIDFSIFLTDVAGAISPNCHSARAPLEISRAPLETSKRADAVRTKSRNCVALGALRPPPSIAKCVFGRRGEMPKALSLSCTASAASRTSCGTSAESICLPAGPLGANISMLFGRASNVAAFLMSCEGLRTGLDGMATTWSCGFCASARARGAAGRAAAPPAVAPRPPPAAWSGAADSPRPAAAAPPRPRPASSAGASCSSPAASSSPSVSSSGGRSAASPAASSSDGAPWSGRAAGPVRAAAGEPRGDPSFPGLSAPGVGTERPSTVTPTMSASRGCARCRMFSRSRSASARSSSCVGLGFEVQNLRTFKSSRPLCQATMSQARAAWYAESKPPSEKRSPKSENAAL
mmetsp:Transcript_19688/g.67610  ORF Transcript_19688/g.67610 Transcript_19688/m.67610 type:complete len:413 (+) Transcript_19688:753-1991(+)